MAAYLAPVGNDQLVDVNGKPVVGGKIWTYLAGTTTPAPTFSDSAGLVAQANPILLNALGLPANAIRLQGGTAYKFVFLDEDDVTARATIDNITGINDPAVSSNIGQWISFPGTPTYINATSFSVPGDQTNTFKPGLRLLTANTGGTAYSSVVSSVYSAGPNTTTVRVINESGVLDTGISAVSYGIISPNNTSLPVNFITPTYRNRKINGTMQQDNRYVGSAHTIVAGAAWLCTIDRWFAACTGANVTGQQITLANGQSRYRFTGATSNTGTSFVQRIEAQNSLDMAGSPVTDQVKVSSTSITTLTWAAYSANSVNTFGTIASPSKTLIATGTHTISATEQVYSAQFTPPAGAINGLEVLYTTGPLLAGQTLIYGDSQTEPGTIATAVERPKIGDIVTQCGRFFEKSYDAGTAPGTPTQFGAKRGLASAVTDFYDGGQVRYAVPKRAAATIVIRSRNSGVINALYDEVALTDFGTITPLHAKNGQTGFDFAVSSGGMTISRNYSWHWTAESELYS